MAQASLLSTDARPGFTRRTLLRASAAIGGGLLLAISAPGMGAPLAAPDAPPFSPNAFVRIGRDGAVTLVIPQVEMGQGIYTALAMVIAEELDAAFDRVSVEAAPPNDALYANPLLGFQATGGSTSIRAFWGPMRVAGAGARALLVEAAAAQWGVEPAACRTADGEVFHDASGRKAGYGELVDAAARLTPPQHPPLKAPDAFTLIGRPLKRLDTPDKVNGKAIYGIDARPPNVKIATLASCPVFGGKVAHVDDFPRSRRAGREADRRARRSRRRRRRPYVGGEARSRSARHRMGRGAERPRVDPRRPRRSRSREPPPGRGGEIDRGHGQGAGGGTGRRSDLSRAVPGACADGADELHGRCPFRRLRDLGRQSDPRANARPSPPNSLDCRSKR